MSNLENLLSHLTSQEPTSKNLNSLQHFSLRKQRIGFRAFESTLHEIALLHYRWRQSSVSEGLLVYGQQGSTKSSVAEFYLQHFPRAKKGIDPKIPLVYALTPETPTVGALSDVILGALGDPLRRRGTSASKLELLVHFFEQCQVEMLILDEFHHFYDSHRVAEGRRITDWLKILMSRTKICIVLIGLPRSIAALNANPQLRRRFAAPFHLREFSFLSVNDQKEFRGFLQQLEELMPVNFDPPLSSAHQARRMYYATHGLTDYVIKILDDAVASSGARAGDTLSSEHLALAFSRKVWSACPDWLNPFRTEQLRLLTKPREPFCDWDDPMQYLQSTRAESSPSSASKVRKAAKPTEAA